MKILPTLLCILIAQLSFSQEKNKFLFNVWGEISKQVPEHRGKEGLLLLEITPDYKFNAFENSDYGPAVLQKGTISLKKNKIIFTVQSTKNFSEKEQLKGKILEEDTGSSTFTIKNLTRNEFVIVDDNTSVVRRFKPSKYNYFPK